MAIAALRGLIDGHVQRMPLTVEQYHAMIAEGIVAEGEPYELLDGLIVRKDRSAAGEDPMTVGNDHALVVKRLAKLSRRFEPLGCHVQTQQPVTLPPYHEPEPDAAIVRGTEEDYGERHPGAKDVVCIIEVADASLRQDRTAKLELYADSGISTYMIINLPDRIIEVYTNPRAGKGLYNESTTISPGQTVIFPAAKGRQVTVPARRLLP